MEKRSLKHKILIGDDSDLNIAAQIYFESQGHTVLIAPTAEEMVLILKKHGEDIDLVITDYNYQTGLKTGLDVIEEGSELSEAIFYLWSSEIDSRIKVRAIEVGATRLINKPVNLTELEEFIREDFNETD